MSSSIVTAMKMMKLRLSFCIGRGRRALGSRVRERAGGSVRNRRRRLTGSDGLGAPEIGGEPYQRAFHIVKQPRPGPGREPPAGDEHIVAPGPPELRQRQPRGLAQPPLGAVAHHGPADPARRREADPDRPGPVVSVPDLRQYGSSRAGKPLRRRQEIGPLAQPFKGWALRHRSTAAASGWCGDEGLATEDTE